MIKSPIARTMAAVAIAGVDASWLNVVMFGGDSIAGFSTIENGHVFDFGLIGMLNVMAFALLTVKVSDIRRFWFLVGFLATGMVAMTAYWLICKAWGGWLQGNPGTGGWGLFSLGDAITRQVRALGLDPILKVGARITNPAVFAVWTACLTLPQLVVALFGGWLFRWVAVPGKVSPSGTEGPTNRR